MKKTKKRYAKCPKCGHYTRYEQKEANSRWLLFSPAVYALKTPTNKRPPCSNCGYNEKKFTFVFLDTETDDNGKELAYYTPEGERIPLP